MNETLKRIIEKSGAMWAASSFDRTITPVLVHLCNAADEVIYELWMETGAAHPYWTVRERELTDEEAFEVMKAAQGDRAQFSVRLMPSETHYEGFGAVAWIKNGRSDRWLPHVMKARLVATWESF